MTDLLSIGASGVRAYQTALGVVGENIANVNTPGYVRRELRLNESAVSSATQLLQLDRRVFGGVEGAGIVRQIDAFRAAEVRTTSADLARTQAGVQWLEQAETAFTAGNISARLTGFFNAANALAADPSGIAPRTNFLDQADAVASAIRDTAGRLRGIADNIVTAASSAADQLNSLTASLAQVNTGLRKALPGSNAAAALADERDRLLDKMASLTAISVSENSDGSVDVRLNHANGPALITGDKAVKLTVSGANGNLVMTFDAYGDPRVVAMTGGALAGLADAAARIQDARQTLDGIASGFAAAVNATQAAGVDLDGNRGAPLFTAGHARITPSPTTIGGGTIDVAVSATATPFPAGYTLTYDGANSHWQLQRADGTGAVTGNGSLTLDGITVEVGGNPRDYDRYDIQIGQGAEGLRLTDIDPRGIAAASPFTTDSTINNAGSGRLSVAVDSAAAGLPTPALPRYTVTYNAGQVEISDPTTSTVLATLPYVAGSAIAGAGFSLTLSGAPADGDSFTLVATGANSRNNGNLAGFQTLRTSGAFESRVDGLVGGNAAALEARRDLVDAQTAIRDGAVAQRDAASGVNLDAEAVDLLRFQQAFQASSRIIQVARENFQSILDIR